MEHTGAMVFCIADSVREKARTLLTYMNLKYTATLLLFNYVICSLPIVITMADVFCQKRRLTE
jgi:hypothetical protein